MHAQVYWLKKAKFSLIQANEQPDNIFHCFRSVGKHLRKEYVFMGILVLLSVDVTVMSVYICGKNMYLWVYWCFCQLM